MLKVVVGSGNTNYAGWLMTQESELSLASSESWRKKFAEESIDAILAEHVWEHMTYEQGIVAAKIGYLFLKPGGYIRCAVPDKNFRNEWYQNMVQVGGPGPIDHPAYSHKIVYDYELLTDVFQQAGFMVSLLEYCDKGGNFHYTYWNEADGRIGRSFRFDTRNSDTKLGMVSLIIDAKKPLVIHYSQ